VKPKTPRRALRVVFLALQRQLCRLSRFGPKPLLVRVHPMPSFRSWITGHLGAWKLARHSIWLELSADLRIETLKIKARNFQ
jgi:hypothetical protein